MPVKSPTPEERARELWSHMQLHEPRVTAWDLICFCSETIGVLSGEYEFLQEIAKKLISITYTAHNTLDALPSCLSSLQSQDTAPSSELGSLSNLELLDPQ